MHVREGPLKSQVTSLGNIRTQTAIRVFHTPKPILLVTQCDLEMKNRIERDTWEAGNTVCWWQHPLLTESEWSYFDVLWCISWVIVNRNALLGSDLKTPDGALLCQASQAPSFSVQKQREFSLVRGREPAPSDQNWLLGWNTHAVPAQEWQDLYKNLCNQKSWMLGRKVKS